MLSQDRPILAKVFQFQPSRRGGPGRAGAPGLICGRRCWAGQGEGVCAGVMGPSETCLKSCNRSGVKNARGENLWAKIGGLGKDWLGLGKDCILWSKI